MTDQKQQNHRFQGRVHFYNNQKGYEFIAPLSGQENIPSTDHIFVHYSNLRDENGKPSPTLELRPSELVEFEFRKGRKGWEASNVRSLERHLAQPLPAPSPEPSPAPSPAPDTHGRYRGEVVHYFENKGFGLIKPDEDQPLPPTTTGEVASSPYAGLVGFHYTEIAPVEVGGFKSMEVGDRVEFDLVVGRKSYGATNVSQLEREADLPSGGFTARVDESRSAATRSAGAKR